MNATYVSTVARGKRLFAMAMPPEILVLEGHELSRSPI